MRVLYVGNFEPDYSTENDVRRAFEHLGWTVDRWQEREFIAASRDREAMRLFTDRARGVDLVLHTMTQGNYPPVTVEAWWAWCRDLGIPTASIHLDRFYGLASPKDAGPQRQDLPKSHPMFKVDYVFTADGDSDELFARDGVNHFWLPPAVRFDEARDIEPTAEDREKFGSFEVGFCGAGSGYHPEDDRVAFIREVARHFGSRFVRVAGDTEYGTMRGEALNRMYRCVPVWIGASCFAGTSSRYTSDRLFETWGRGGFLVHPRLEGIVDLLGTEYPSWAPYEDRDALYTEVERWLADPEAREAERHRMAGLIRSGHTYVNRVQTLLDVIGLPYEGKSCTHAAMDGEVCLLCGAYRGTGPIGQGPQDAATCHEEPPTSTWSPEASDYLIDQGEWRTSPGPAVNGGFRRRWEVILVRAWDLRSGDAVRIETGGWRRVEQVIQEGSFVDLLFGWDGEEMTVRLAAIDLVEVQHEVAVER